MSKVLVTGAAGYIGSILVPMLLDRGHEVTALDTYARNDTVLAHLCADPKFKPVRGDARDERLMRDLVRDVDYAVPLAALVGAPLCKLDPINAETTNLGAVKLLLGLMSNEQRVIYPTTNSGYGIGQGESACTEESPLNPISLYGTTKCDAERLVLDRGNGVTLRLATVFGMAPRMRVDLLVNDFTYRAVNDRAVVLFEGHFKRNYIHIRDVASTFVHAMDNYDRMNANAYNVGLSSANLSKIELCERIAKFVPGFTYLSAAIGEDIDKRNYIVSNDKLEATGWQPAFDLDTGIKELLRGYQMIKNARYSLV